MQTVLSRTSVIEVLQEISAFRRSQLGDAVDAMRESLTSLNPDQQALQRWLRAQTACAPWLRVKSVERDGDLITAVADTRAWIRDQLTRNDGSSTELVGAVMEVYTLVGHRQFLDDTSLVDQS